MLLGLKCHSLFVLLRCAKKGKRSNPNYVKIRFIPKTKPYYYAADL